MIGAEQPETTTGVPCEFGGTRQQREANPWDLIQVCAMPYFSTCVSLIPDTYRIWLEVAEGGEGASNVMENVTLQPAPEVEGSSQTNGEYPPGKTKI